MDRRSLIKSTFILGTGTWLLPSLLSGCSADSQFALKRLKLTRKEERLLGLLSETIIPKTDTPGACDLGVPVFIAKMIDDCSSAEELAMFSKGMELFAKSTVNGKSFERASTDERIRFLEDTHEETLQLFLVAVRTRTIEAYTYSKYVTTKLVPYKLVPGPFRGKLKL